MLSACFSIVCPEDILYLLWSFYLFSLFSLLSITLFSFFVLFFFPPCVVTPYVKDMERMRREGRL